jgi:hypothetical protein
MRSMSHVDKFCHWVTRQVQYLLLLIIYTINSLKLNEKKYLANLLILIEDWGKPGNSKIFLKFGTLPADNLPRTTVFPLSN